MWASPRALVITGTLVVLLATMTVATRTNGSSVEATPPLADGQAIFQTVGCIACHSIGVAVRGGQIGPNLAGLAQRAGTRIEGATASDYVRQSIREPDAYTVSGFGRGVMPLLPLADIDVDTLVEYLLEN